MPTPKIIAHVWSKNRQGNQLHLDDYVSRPFSKKQKTRIEKLFDTKEGYLYFLSNASFLFNNMSGQKRNKFLSLLEVAADGNHYNTTDSYSIPQYKQIAEIAHPLSELTDVATQTVDKYFEAFQQRYMTSAIQFTDQLMKSVLKKAPEHKEEIVSLYQKVIASKKQRRLIAMGMDDMISLSSIDTLAKFFDRLSEFDDPDNGSWSTTEIILNHNSYFAQHPEKIDKAFDVLQEQKLNNPKTLSDFARPLPYILDDEYFIRTTAMILDELQESDSRYLGTVASVLSWTLRKVKQDDYKEVMRFASEHFYPHWLDDDIHQAYLAMSYGAHMYPEKGMGGFEEGLRNTQMACDVLNARDYGSPERKMVEKLVDTYGLEKIPTEIAREVAKNLSGLETYHERFNQKNYDLYKNTTQYILDTQGKEAFNSFVTDISNFLIPPFFDGARKIKVNEEPTNSLANDRHDVSFFRKTWLQESLTL